MTLYSSLKLLVFVVPYSAITRNKARYEVTSCSASWPGVAFSRWLASSRLWNTANLCLHLIHGGPICVGAFGTHG